MSLVTTCKARGIDAEAYLKDVLERLGKDPSLDPATLMPRACQKAHAQAR
ncbi:MAG: transposase domain-containing protein [Planctomycetia bacterium]|nr:transposase domain-containing protein [Planctomycetia bacterium]